MDRNKLRGKVARGRTGAGIGGLHAYGSTESTESLLGDEVGTIYNQSSACKPSRTESNCILDSFDMFLGSLVPPRRR